MGRKKQRAPAKRTRKTGGDDPAIQLEFWEEEETFSIGEGGIIVSDWPDSINCALCRQRVFYRERNSCSRDTLCLWELGETTEPAYWAEHYAGLSSREAEGIEMQDAYYKVLTISDAPATNFWRMWALNCSYLVPGMTPVRELQRIGAMHPAKHQLGLSQISAALWQGEQGDSAGEELSFLYVSSVFYELQQKEDLCWYQSSPRPEVRTERTLRTTFLHTQSELLYGESCEGEEAANLAVVEVVERGLKGIRALAEGQLATWVDRIVIVGDEGLGTEENIAAWRTKGERFLVQVPWLPHFDAAPRSAYLESFEDQAGHCWSAARLAIKAQGLHYLVIHSEDAPQALPRVLVTNLEGELGELSRAWVGHRVAQQTLLEEDLVPDQPLRAAYFATAEHRKGFATLWYVRALLLGHTRRWLTAYDRSKQPVARWVEVGQPSEPCLLDRLSLGEELPL